MADGKYISTHTGLGVDTAVDKVGKIIDGTQTVGKTQGTLTITQGGVTAGKFNGYTDISITVPSTPEIATATTAGLVKPVTKGSSMTQTVGVDSNGRLWTAIPVASASTLGGVKAVAKTSDMTQEVGVDNNGKLWLVPGGGEYTLPTASSTTLGGVKVGGNLYIDSTGTLTAAYAAGTNISISSTNVISCTYTYTLPIATEDRLGGVKPVTKTDGMTQMVGVDSAGRLYTTPSSAATAAWTYADTLPTASDTSVPLVYNTTNEGAYIKIFE